MIEQRRLRAPLLVIDPWMKHRAALNPRWLGVEGVGVLSGIHGIEQVGSIEALTSVGVCGLSRREAGRLAKAESVLDSPGFSAVGGYHR